MESTIENENREPRAKGGRGEEPFGYPDRLLNLLVDCWKSDQQGLEPTFRVITPFSS